MPTLEVAVSSSNAPERPLPKYCASKIWYVLFLCLPMMFGPNITGETVDMLMWNYKQASFSGALSRAGKGHDSCGMQGGSYFDLLCFDASDSQSMYGSSNTVQPSSVRFFACIKT